MEKAIKLKDLYLRYKNTFSQEEFVPGEGNENAELLLIGEAPGKDEVKLQRPFVGMAGKNLDEFLNMLGTHRQDIYITNAIKFRLAKINEKTGRVSNRPAATSEIKVSRDYLLEEISIISPKYIVTLGNVPLRSVTGNMGVSIGDFHGDVHKVDINGLTYSLFPLYHPASIIYNQSLKQVYKDDIGKLRNVMESGTIV